MKQIVNLACLLAMASSLFVSCADNTVCNDGEAAISVIMNRKSVRSFTGEKLTDIQVEKLLKAAMAAPTNGNMQPWEFVVLKDSSAVNSLFGEGHHADMYKNAGAIILVCGHTTALRKPKGQPDAEPKLTANDYWTLDCSAATENLLLAAEAMGLGAVWMTAYPVEGKMSAIASALNFPEDVLPLAVVPVGYPDGDYAPKDKWNESKVHVDKW